MESYESDGQFYVDYYKATKQKIGAYDAYYYVQDAGESYETTHYVFLENGYEYDVNGNNAKDVYDVAQSVSFK
jgi:hypothetical protein